MDLKSACAGITQEDINAVFAMQVSQGDAEAVVFYNHVSKIDDSRAPMLEEQPLEEHVGVDAKPYFSFACFCTNMGVKTDEEAWDVAGTLTQRKDGARLIYDLQKHMFFWDDDSCVPNPSEDTLVAKVFSLSQAYPDMQEKVFCYMLKQKGFQGVNVADVREIQVGLGALGLHPITQEADTQLRKNIDCILSPDFTSHALNDDCAHRVAGWVRNGPFHKLWQAYQEAQGAEPPCKRQKLDKNPRSAEDIICSEMPNLYTILQKYSAANYA